MRSIFLFSFVFIFSCSASIRTPSSECDEYYEFIRNNWIQFNSQKKVYGFNGNPEYWKGETKKYFQRECVIGLNKKQVIKLLGHPSKSFVFYDLEIAYYCMEEGCLKSIKSGGKELVINYNTDGIVIEAYLNPLGVDSN